jgi:hypothetical protein
MDLKRGFGVGGGGVFWEIGLARAALFGKAGGLADPRLAVRAG